MVVAVLLSHRLNLPVHLLPHSYSLIVDDILETGETLAPFCTHDCAVLFAKPNPPFMPSFVGKQIDPIGWLFLPWKTLKGIS